MSSCIDRSRDRGFFPRIVEGISARLLRCEGIFKEIAELWKSHTQATPLARSRQLKSSLRRQNVAVDAAVDITSILSISSRECGNGTERERNKTEKFSFRRLAGADSTARQIAPREGRYQRR